jgi:AraC-like DNA-binding protein
MYIFFMEIKRKPVTGMFMPVLFLFILFSPVITVCTPADIILTVCAETAVMVLPDTKSGIDEKAGSGQSRMDTGVRPVFMKSDAQPVEDSAGNYSDFSSANNAVKSDFSAHTGIKFFSGLKKQVLLSAIVLSTCFVLFLVYMILIVIRNRSDSYSFVTKTRLSIMDREVQKACMYIEKNFRTGDLSTQSICKELTTGTAFLEALFMQELGIDISAFISNVRINRARILIEKNPDTDMQTAACECGFQNMDVFAAEFKKITGIAFDNYRAGRYGSNEQAGPDTNLHDATRRRYLSVKKHETRNVEKNDKS